jgi:hypothetical protein
MRSIPKTDDVSRLARPALIIAALMLFRSASPAASFTLTSNSTTPQTLGPGSGQTGTINAGVSLTVSGSSVAVTITGNNATLNNNGSLLQIGTGRAVRDNTGVTGLTINNGSTTNSAALMRTADADVIQMNKAAATVTLNNYGTMTSLNSSAGGAQVADFNAITSGANIINSYSTGLMLADQADAVRPGVNGEVYNYGTIRVTSTTGSSSDGIDSQTNSGLKFINYSTGILEGARHGVTGGAIDNTVTWTASITNQAGGVIKGNDGSGINLDGFNNLQTVTIVNGGTITGNGLTRDGDGIDVDGIANVTNTGVIQSLKAFSSTTPAMSEGITIGGGTVINSGVIEGLVAAGSTNAFGRGITFAGNDITSGPLTGTREAIYGNARVINQSGGLIKGQSDSAIAVEGPASGYTVNILNNAGATLLGGSATAAAVLTGADNDVITNSGLIDGSSSGLAIDMGAGNNVLQITGGSAVKRID